MLTCSCQFSHRISYFLCSLLTLVSGTRIRRLKCDETKPACVRCTSTGRTCDGYKNDVPCDPPTASELAPVMAQSIPNELSIGIGGDRVERRGFHFFQSYVWPQLSSELHSVFWERLILQASHSDAAIRHAAIAFGSLGERLLINNVMTFDNEDANRLHNFARVHYCKAIQELRKQLSSGRERSVESTLIACFIFSCFEFLQGNETAALTHLKSGIEIIRQSGFHDVHLDPNNSSGPLTESVDFGYHVNIIFAVLDRSAANWVAAPSFGMPMPVPNTLDYRSFLSDGFPNIDKAEEYFHNLRLQLNRILPAWTFVPSDSNNLPRPTIIPLVDELFQTLDNWSQAINAFIARSQHKLSVQESQKAKTLVMHHKVAVLRLTASFQANEEEFYRNSEPDFNYIISMSTPLLLPVTARIDLRGSDDERNRLLFSFHCSIIYPLYFTAIHCQNTEIQQNALSLLSSSPWREGAWDSAAMARIAERKIRQREQDLSCNNTRHIDHIVAGLDMTGHDLPRRRYQFGESFNVPEERITEITDGDRFF